MSSLRIETDGDAIVFTAKIVPGSSRTAIAGVLNGMVKIKVAAPPEKGKANQSLVAFLAERLGVRKNDVTILSGQTNPVKQIRVAEVSAQVFIERLGLAEQ
jgi:uncharacterized protein (TIGR00251 family)